MSKKKERVLEYILIRMFSFFLLYFTMVALIIMISEMYKALSIVLDMMGQ